MPAASGILEPYQATTVMTRRQFIRRALGWSALSNCVGANAANIFRCTPAPSFPVPLTQGIWRSQEFPVGKHGYHVSLEVDRRTPLEDLDCDLGPPRPGHQCNTPPCSTWTGKFGTGRRWSRIGKPSRSKLAHGAKHRQAVLLVASRAKGTVISLSN